MKPVQCLAPANIAFIKYWGKLDSRLRTPLNNSVSMNLDGFYCISSIAPAEKEEIRVKSTRLKREERLRLEGFVQQAKRKLGIFESLTVEVRSYVPRGVGLASSAAVFASLAGALSAYSGELREKNISMLARLGSGSACRSVPAGFVRWRAGDEENSYAYSIAPPEHLSLVDLVFPGKRKAVSSTEGQQNVRTSTYLPARLKEVRKREKACVEAIKSRDYHGLFECVIDETLSFLALLLTQKPPLMYLSLSTLKTVAFLHRLKLEGLPLAFTVDAGDTLHLLICEKDLSKLPLTLRQRATIARPAKGICILT